MPFAVEDRVDQPVSLYAATKRADELMSHCYSHLYRIRRPACASSPSTGPGAGRTWPTASPTRSPPADRSRSTTTARWRATSPTSTTSSRACSPRSTGRPGRRRRRRTGIYNLGNHQPGRAPPLRRGAGGGARQARRDRASRPLPPGDVIRHLRRHRGQPRATSASSRKRRSRRACRASSPGTASTTGCDQER